MIVMSVRGRPAVTGNWGKGWEIQVQLVAVESKLERMQKEMGKRRAFISQALDPCYEEHGTGNYASQSDDEANDA